MACRVLAHGVDAVVNHASRAGKILFTIEACLNDSYDVINDSVAVVSTPSDPPADWSSVAE